MSIGIKRHRFTVEEYHRLGEAGILPDNPRVELIAGTIMVREPVGSYHAGTVDRLTRLWTSRLGDRAIVRVQNPVQFPTEDSELQPDVMLLRPRDDFYTRSHPLAADVLLLIEVADSTLRLDRRIKMPLYARTGVREAWLCDLVSDRVEVYRGPGAGRYREVAVLGRGEALTALAFPDVTLTVQDLLG